MPEYHVVHPARVDASGHFLSFNLHHHISSPRKKRDLRKSENVVYYKIIHEEKDLFFNLTVHMGFLSHNYIVERRRGNHTRAKISAHSGVPCHFLGTAWQPGSGNGTAAISTCSGLVSVLTFSVVLGCFWCLWGWAGMNMSAKKLDGLVWYLTNLERSFNSIDVVWIFWRIRKSKDDAEGPWH